MLATCFTIINLYFPGKKRKGDNKENGEAANKKAKTENGAKPAENGAKSEGDAKSPKRKFKKGIFLDSIFINCLFFFSMF